MAFAFDRDLVSVCLPAQNEAAHVYSAIESLLGQSYRNLEILVVDDGSTDETRAVVQSFDDARVQLIAHDVQMGRSARLNEMLAAARGTFIAFMDADAVCRSDRIARQVACLRSGYELAGSYVAMGRSPALVRRVHQPSLDEAELVRSILFGEALHTTSMMVKRSLLEGRDGLSFPSRWDLAADYAAWAKLILSGRAKAFITPAPLVFKRSRPKADAVEDPRPMTFEANEVRAQLMAPLGIAHEVIALHNKALVRPVSEAEISILTDLHQQQLAQALPQAFTAGHVSYPQNTCDIPLALVAAKPRSRQATVIIPAYNVAGHLDTCVRSVLAQNPDYVEVVLIDDGSTDNTPELCADLEREFGAQFRFFRQDNAGPSVARNAGVAQAEGDYVFFLDGDDYLAPSALETLLRQAEKTGADVTLSTHAAFFEDTNICEPRLKISKEQTYDKDIFDAFIKGAFGRIAANKLICRRLAQSVLFHEGIFYEDELYSVALFLKASRVTTIPDTLYFYRQRHGSITSTVTKRHVRDWMTVTEMVMLLGFQYGLETRGPEGFGKLMSYFLFTVRHKLSQMEMCPEVFANDIYQTVNRIEAALISVCGFHDPDAHMQTGTGETRRNAQARRGALNELRALQTRLELLNRSTE